MKSRKNIVSVKNVENKVVAFGNFLNRHIYIISCMLLLGIITIYATSASATGGANADNLWKTVSNLIQTWVTRLGGVIMFVGGVMFGLGWKSDDAEQKSRGVSTMISGAIIIAIAASTSTFFT